MKQFTRITSLVTALALAFLCVLAFPAEANAATEGYYTYEVIDGEATITDCNMEISGDVTIPSTLGGYPVTSIGVYAFEDCWNMTSIDIPDSVTSIGKYAFYFCGNLTDVTIGNGVTSIGDWAFKYCEKLTSIIVDADNTYYTSEDGVLFSKDKTLLVYYSEGKAEEIYQIPDSATSIADYAFYGHPNLVSISIPNSVTLIGDYAFSWCHNLTSITVDADNAHYASENGVLFNKDKTLLICYPIGKTEETYQIPDSVTSIGDDAFSGCYSLTSINIPDSVTLIGDYAFSWCDSLTKVIYCGTQEQWNAIDIGEDNEALTEATLQFHDYQDGICTLCGSEELIIIEKLKAPMLTKDGEIFTWEAVAYADAYEVYRATSKSGKYTKVATITETTWQDATAAGKTYYYKVKSILTGDSSKNSDLSSAVSIDYKCEAPVVTVANGSTGKPVISWEKIAGASKYTVYRATSENGKYTSAGTSKTPSFTDTKAKAGTTYFYKVVANASSSKNNSGYSNIVSCGVICGTPSVTVKIDAATGKPSLSWAKVEGAANYRILRQLPGEETFTEIAKQTGTTFADTTAPIDTVCQYQVQALGANEELNGAVSKTVTATSGIARPAMKATVDAVSGKPTLTWETVEGAVKYEIYRSTKSTKGYTLLATVETTSYADESVAAGKTYYYKMVAIGEVSKSAETAYVKLTGKCTVPTITVENGPAGKPVISWEKIAGASKYTVYRATSENGKYTSAGTSKTQSFTDTKAKAGTTYFYKVVANASSSKNNSGYSNIVSCGVICGTPSVTVKIDAATGKPSLSWAKVEGAASYSILRQLPGEETFTEIAKQTGTTFADTTAPIDTVCQYQVQALGATEELNGAISQVVQATSGIARPAMTATVDAVSGKPTLTWEAVEGAVKYEIYRSTKSTKGYTLLATVDTTSYADESVAAGKTYYYKMVAIGEVGKSAETAYVKLTGKCAVPTITVRIDEASGKPTISWEKVEGAKQYTVYRATSENGKYTKLKAVKTLSYTDTKAAVGTTYYYKVVANASSSKNSSGYSNFKKATAICAAPAVKLTVASSGKPVLSWAKVTGAVKYEVYLLGGEDYVVLGTVTGTSFTDETCMPGEGRYYGVRAIAEKEGYNSEVSEPILGRGAHATPKATGKVGATGKPEITWGEVEGATRYVIYRSTSKTKNFKTIGESETLSYTDATASKGKTYYYKVVAISQDAESAQSDTVKVKSK